MARFLIMTRRLPGFDAQWLDGHYAFLDRLRGEGRLELAGPFGDGTGGAYLVFAGSLEEARAIAGADPLILNACSEAQIHEWRAV